MITRKTMIVTFSLVLIGFAALHARQEPARHANRLTFSQPVALPGVTLAAGTYTFERATPGGASNVIRVSSPDGRRVFFTGFTESVTRPAGLGNRLVTFGEAANGAPRPITAWYPLTEPTGHRFIYR